MKYFTIVFAVLMSATFINAQEQEMNQETVGYSAGLIIAKNLKAQGMDEINVNSFMEGFKDVMDGKELKMSEAEANLMLKNFTATQQQKQFQGVKVEGEQFLAKNGQRPEVTTLPSGLQYEILTKGDGPKPAATDKVKTHYHGTLIDGTVFDSSVDRGEPIEFPVNGVIQGWQEALQLMPKGSKWKLFVPYTLAYGERGAGGQIQPFSALVFEVELIDFTTGQ